MSRYLELKAQHEALTTELETVRLEERHDAIAQCRQLMEIFDLSAQDLGLVKVQQLPPRKTAPPTFAVKVPKGTYPPKYRDPASGKTWSGNGHTPRWMEGDRDDYLIKNANGHEHGKHGKHEQHEAA
jgi:DNA-binding protein H-NS